MQDNGIPPSAAVCWPDAPGGVAKLSGIFFIILAALHQISHNAFTLMVPTCISLVIVRCSADVSFPPAGSAACELTGPTGRVSGMFKSSTADENELLGGWVLLLLCDDPLDEATAGMFLTFRFHLAERYRAS